MRCPACDAGNQPGSRFCSTCGSALAAASSPDAYTPLHLARRIRLSAAALAGERKLVTVLFADLKGSTELIARRDPEDANDLLTPVLERMMEAVHRYEGTVNQVMGDGIMALFGAPLAHEDHALRACYAALRMQASIRRYAAQVDERLGVSVQIRVGLNSGPVVVRSVGSDLRTDYSAVGETTHLAARMEQLAPPGSILMAQPTRLLVEGFVQAAALGLHPVKGLPDPVEVHELTGLGPARSRLQAATGPLSPFVGREREHALLLDALEHARAHHGQIVAVVGEPGVGKSRLYWELVRALETTDWQVLKAGALSHGQAVLWGPVVDLLRAFFGVGAHDEPAHARETIVSKLATLGSELAAAAPPLLALLEIPVADDEWTTLEPPHRRRRTLDVVKLLLARASHAHPLVVILEDLHWVDSETQALLDELVDALPTLRALLLVNHRPEYRHRWADKIGCLALSLEPLAPDTAGDLRTALLGDDPSLGPLAPLLDARAQGNPFFLEEIVRALAADGSLAGPPGAYRLAKPLEATAVPATVQALLAARIDRVDPDDKLLLQAAAVLGDPVPVDLLALVAARDERTLLDGLARLDDAGLLHPEASEPDVTYRFKHALTRQVAYESLLAVRRRAAHAAVVVAIEHRHRDRLDEWLPHLAHHAVRGEVWDQAVTYCRRAASRAIQHAAYPLASSLLEEALTVLARLPESRTALETAVDIRRELYASLWGQLGRDRGVGPRMVACTREALRLAEALEDPQRIAMVLGILAQALVATGDPPAGVETGRRALAVLEATTGMQPVIHYVHYVLAQAYRLVGDVRRSAVHAEHATLPEGMARPGISEAQNVGQAAWRANLAISLGDTGEFDRGLALAAEGRRRAEALRHPFSILDTSWAHSLLHLRRGALTEAVEELEPALERARAWGVALFVQNFTASLGYAYALLGRFAEAIPLVETPHAGVGNEALFDFYLGETYALAGRLDDAATWAEHGLTLCQGRPGIAVWGERLLGIIASARDPHDVERSAAHYRLAIEGADEMGARPLGARCHLDMGRAYARAHRLAEAARHLTTAIERMRDMGMARWLEAAERELRLVTGYG